MLEYDVYSLYPRLNVKNTSMPLKKQRKKITCNKGILYNPSVVDVCLKLFKEKGFWFMEETYFNTDSGTTLDYRPNSIC